MKQVKALKSSATFEDLKRKVSELINENNRKTSEIRQLKGKLRINAHYKRV